jgi:putative ABC transport system permease protein
LEKASSIATVLMMIIVMTGILGLVSLNVSKRNKEIGIRKVLGASVSGILLMLSREYARLMVTSFVLAAPLAYYFTNQWLNNFVYHIDLSWWMFALPGALLLLITLLMVVLQSYKTAITDPVKSLKYE